jgi:hypothetical protein
MSDDADPPTDEPEVVGVPATTPPGVRPSTTGLVPGPLAEEPEVEVAAVRGAPDAEDGESA